MTDTELIDGLRHATLPSDGFRHQDHIRAAWLYLGQWGLVGTLSRFPDDLRRYAGTHDQPELYNETMTWTFLLAVNERRRQLPADHAWPEFAERFPELFDWQGFIGRYYSDDLLFSDLARAEFVLPDRVDPTPSWMLG